MGMFGSTRDLSSLTMAKLIVLGLIYVGFQPRTKWLNDLTTPMIRRPVLALANAGLLALRW